MKDLRTPEEKTFIEYLDAVCEDMGMNWSVSISAAASRLIIERDGVAMLRHPDERFTLVDGE